MPFVKHTDAVDGGNGAASNCHDFIKNKLIPFAISSSHFPSVGDRWILERTDVIATNEEELFISGPTNVANTPVIAFHTRDSAAYMFAGTSYVGGVEAYALPGNTRQHPQDTANSPDWADVTNDRHPCSWTNVWPTTGLTAHWLYAPSDGAYIYAVIQLATRRFRHIMFGAYDKFVSAMTGGEFFGCLYWAQTTSVIDNPFKIDRDHSSGIVTQATSLGEGLQCGAFRAGGLRTGAPVGPSAVWQINGRGFSSGSSSNPRTGKQRPTGAGSPPWDTANNAAEDLGRGWCNMVGYRSSPGASFLFYMQQSLIANVKPLLPINLWALGYQESQNRYHPVGQMPDIFRINMEGFTPAQDLVVGSDTYSLFPVVNSDQINTAANEEYSAFDGFAIRQRS